MHYAHKEQEFQNVGVIQIEYHVYPNPCPAEPRYTLPLQIV